MKRITFILLVSFSLLSCFSNPQPKVPETPRREYESVNTEGMNYSDIFIVNKYSKSSFTPSLNSIRFSTALFFSDLDMLDEVTELTFQKFATILFTDFPTGDEFKEIVIPSLSSYVPKGDEKSPIEKNAYLFVKLAPSQGDFQSYRIETNIPIQSIFAKDYDGYMMNRKANYYRNNVPARWTAIMNIAFNDSKVIYEGVAYPQRAAPLIYTGTGIGSDGLMKKVIAKGSNIDETIRQLNDVVTETTTELPSDPGQLASILFLRKYTAMSLSAYEYLNEKEEKALNHLLDSSAINVAIPTDIKGNQFTKLEKIMNYLLREHKTK